MPKIAVWVPSVGNLKDLASWGIEAAWCNEGATPSSMSMFDYYQKVLAAGMHVWSFPYQACRNPGGMFSPDIVALQDEPVMHSMAPDAYHQQIATFQGFTGNKLPFVGNFEGDKFSMYKPADTAKPEILSTWKNVNAKHAPYFQNQPPGMINFLDFFIFNRPRYNADQTFDWYPLDNIFASIDFILQYQPEVGVICEASNQCIDVNSRAPNRAELRAEVIGSLIWGAKHIGYFIGRPGNKKPNWAISGTVEFAVPSDLVPEIKLLNKFMKDYEEILDNRINTVREVNLPFISRLWPSGHELILNRSKKSATTAAGVLYQPYEARLYKGNELLWSAAEASPSLPYTPPNPTPVPTPTPTPSTDTVPKADYDKLKIDYNAATSQVTSLTDTVTRLTDALNKSNTAVAQLKETLEASESSLSEVLSAINTLLRHSQNALATPAEPVSLPTNVPRDDNNGAGDNSPKTTG